ncbi:PA14 domain-containing protein [Dokdonella sp.]|uniref:PA14 domain-containing protein n=1 Tax=Dokdonella sp. TaxID=2291710 RepID=UPI001B1D0D46|nr:PA14 domain-containing protein [Dokdonella sp.]MBO9664005.1 DUF1929 domain-containing protein [Dokdonella sp.]
MFQLSSASFAHDLHADAASNASKHKSVEEHWKLDFGFPGFETLNRQLTEAFEDFREPDTSAMGAATQAAKAAAAAAANAHLVGSWGPVVESPVVPIHTTLLVDGRVLFWDSVSDLPSENVPVHDRTRAAVWNPATYSLVRVDNQTGYNLFCAGFAHLPDGRPLLAGGNLNAQLEGTRTIHYFDATTDTWTLSPLQLFGGRWYPSVTPLANGEMLITSGSPTTNTHEVFTTAATLRALSSATLELPLYPWFQAAPAGDALYLGPDNRLSYLKTNGTGSWRHMGGRDGINRDYGSFAMFDVGKVLASGGGASVKSSVVVDFKNPGLNPAVLTTGSMANGRRQHNLTVLPDGAVLATGGNYNGASLIDRNAGVYAAELWDPASGAWRTLSSAARTRQYHSTAMLLPDGRVFTGGGGICGTCYQVGYLEKNFEIFTPPYLYKKDGSGELAPQPGILEAPTAVAYDETFPILTSAPNAIASVVLMRASSVTHSVDFEQRRVPLQHRVVDGVLQATAPANANLAPPGYYMLFIVDADGVPSVAEMVQVRANGLGAPLIVASSGSGTSASLSWVPVPGATGYRIKYGTASGSYTTTVEAGNVTSYTLANLAPGTRNYLTVLAYSGSTPGPDADEVTVDAGLSPGTGSGLRGNYYAGTAFGTLLATRVDPTVNFAWGSAAPAAGVPADNYSVRWLGDVQAPVSGTYTFYTTSDDGVRLSVNGQSLVNNWTAHGATVNSGTIALTAGVKYPLVMEYYEATGSATAKLEWSTPTMARTPVPTDRLYPAAAPALNGVAVGKPASQSSTAYDGNASRAVDGNTNGVFTDGSVTHTASSYQPWWQVDLGSVHDLTQIKVWNRTDCCAERLAKFRVFVSDSPFTSTSLFWTTYQSGVGNYAFSGTVNGSATFNVNRSGRYVRVQLEGTNPLSLAEVQVLGTPR